jgi:hypothetical protein
VSVNEEESERGQAKGAIEEAGDRMLFGEILISA